jgi:hypothetical protein
VLFGSFATEGTSIPPTKPPFARLFERRISTVLASTRETNDAKAVMADLQLS